MIGGFALSNSNARTGAHFSARSDRPAAARALNSFTTDADLITSVMEQRQPPGEQ
jgi:hypothetical protein